MSELEQRAAIEAEIAASVAEFGDDAEDDYSHIGDDITTKLRSEDN